MARAQLQAAANFFLSRVLTAATSKQFSQLQNAEVLLGTYRAAAATPVTAFGKSITPRFTLKVRNTAVPVANNSPALESIQLGDGLVDQPLVWMRYVADAKVDTAAVIKDLMGDVDTYAQKKMALAGVEIDLGGEQNQATSQQWADAIVANRASLPDNLNTLTEVPAGLKTVAPNITALRSTLDHFFTYDNGAYYKRWTGDGRRLPDDLSPEYRDKNVREVILPRDQMYVYMLVPKSLFGAANAEPHDYREAVLRLSPTGSSTRPFAVTLMHSVYKRVTTPHPFHDFIFFESEDGAGLPINSAVRAKMGADLLELLETLPTEAAARAEFVRKNPAIINDTVPRVQLLADLEGTLTPPAGVLVAQLGDGPVMAIQSPLDKVAELAALKEVRFLWLQANRFSMKLDMARPSVDHAGLQAKLAAGKKEGEGVIVGIIDSGIDGQHPSFKDAAGNSRIIAVWQQDEGAAPFPNSPQKKNSTKPAYNLLNYGVEYVGADTRNCTDGDTDTGHGTHVAGIAAGREVTTAGGQVPAGFASKAQIVAVRIRVGADGDITAGFLDGVRYIFQKATEAGKPCVINFSLGTHNHAHDGTDPMSIGATNLLKWAGKYKEGRAIVAAAGNERHHPTRNRNIHFGRDVAQFGLTEMRFDTLDDTINAWLRSPDGSGPSFAVWVRHATSTFSTMLFMPGMSALTTPMPGTGRSITISYTALNAANGDSELRIQFRRAAALVTQESWRVFFLNFGSAVELHAWAGDEEGRFTNVNASDDSHKICSPATSLDVMSIANVNSRLTHPNIDGGTTVSNQTRLEDLSTSSSPGPLRRCSSRSLRLFGLDINLTPIPEGIEVAAPGSRIVSARAKELPLTAIGVTPPPGRLGRSGFVSTNATALSGTSMASPAVAGLIACILADDPKLTSDVIQRRLRAAGKLPAPAATVFDPGAPDANDWGAGKVHAPSLKP